MYVKAEVPQYFQVHTLPIKGYQYPAGRSQDKDPFRKRWSIRVFFFASPNKNCLAGSSPRMWLSSFAGFGTASFFETSSSTMVLRVLSCSNSNEIAFLLAHLLRCIKGKIGKDRISYEESPRKFFSISITKVLPLCQLIFTNSQSSLPPAQCLH